MENANELLQSDFFQLNLNIKLNPDENQIVSDNKSHGSVNINLTKQEKVKADKNEDETKTPLPANNAEATDNESSTAVERFLYHKGNQRYFQMTKSVKGRVIIINNSFAGTGKARVGSRKDVMALENAFTFLGGAKSEVEITILPNLSSCEITERLERFAASEKIPSFYAIVIMSHGTSRRAHDGGLDDLIIGIDGTPLNVTDVIKIFNKNHLKKIPILMFFQMCRGNELGRAEYKEVSEVASREGLYEDDHDNGDRHLKEDKRLRELFCQTLKNGTFITTRKEKDESDSDDETDRSSYEHALDTENMLISFSTTEEYVSIRSKENGSWFIQILCKEIKKNAKTQDFVATMKDVHRILYDKRSKTRRLKNCVIACDTSHTLTKKLQFFPGFPE